MIKKHFKDDLFLTLIISISMIIFLIILYLSKLNLANDDNLYQEFKTLPIYFRLIFYILIPLFKNFRYLFIYSNIYILTIIIIYYIHILNKINLNNSIEITNISNKEYIIKYIFTKILNILIIIIPLYISYIILNISIYKYFDPIIIYGILIHLITIIIITISFYLLAINNIKLFKRHNKTVS